MVDCVYAKLKTLPHQRDAPDGARRCAANYGLSKFQQALNTQTRRGARCEFKMDQNLYLAVALVAFEWLDRRPAPPRVGVTLPCRITSFLAYH